MANTVGLPVHVLPGGTRFVADRDVYELDCLEFVQRFPDFWERHELLRGWVEKGQKPDGEGLMRAIRNCSAS